MSDPLRAALDAMFPSEPARVADCYLPVCAWLAERAREGRRVVALNGPQGAGKSTLCAAAVEALGAVGVRAVTVSIDDFYLPFEAQCALAAQHPGNPYLEFRGYPGTHDLALGAATLDALRGDAGEGVSVPVYDKSAHGGRGDRAPETQWRRVTGPFDLVLVEGWMLGFAPVPTESLPDARMAPSNDALAGYAAWLRRCEALVHLVMADAQSVVRWRVDAERARRGGGAPGLSDEAARDYVMRFVPAYAAWVEPMRATPPVRGPRLTVVLGDNRDAIELSDA
jgi:D-glycerate 3-kinase